jgi:hypothetical protein
VEVPLLTVSFIKLSSYEGLPSSRIPAASVLLGVFIGQVSYSFLYRLFSCPGTLQLKHTIKTGLVKSASAGFPLILEKIYRVNNRISRRKLWAALEVMVPQALQLLENGFDVRLYRHYTILFKMK